MSVQNTIILEFPLIEADFDTAGKASCCIKEALKKIGVSADVIRRVSISSYEAAMNVVIHAFGGMIQAVIYSDRTELIISDEGPGISDINQAVQPGYSTAPDSVRKFGFGGGSGLSNITSYPDECTIESTVGEGTLIHLVIHH